MSTNFKYIEEIADKLLRDNNFYTPNFNIKKLSKKLGVYLIEDELGEDVSGFFVRTDDGPVITYRKGENKKRQRFTIAHELGHFILHSREQPIFVDKKPSILYRNTFSSTGDMLKEREANSFAAALLMPKDLVVGEINNARGYIDDAICYLADTFGVSEQAMSFRLSNLGYGIG